MIKSNMLCICLALVLSGTFALQIAGQQQCIALPSQSLKGQACFPQFPHTELGHAYQKNFNSSVANNTDFQNLDQFALTYFTDEKCIYFQDFSVSVFSNNTQISQILFENFTSAFQNKTVNIDKYSVSSDNLELNYQFSSDYFICKASRVVLPKLFEQKGESYNMCLFNQVKYLNSSTDCNLAQVFHYSADQLFGFFNTSSFQEFIFDHSIHVISNLKDIDADFAPFGSKQWYFTFNFMFQMTLDVQEYDSLNQTLKYFNTAVPRAQLNRNVSRPWFVGIASYSPYQLDLNSGIVLNEELYGALYDNLRNNQFDILISSHPELQQAQVFISKDYRNFQEVKDIRNLTSIKQFEGFVLVYLPNKLETPALLNTSYESLKVSLDNKEIINISASNQFAEIKQQDL